MATVEIRNVRKAFGPVEILHGVSVDIADGEFVVLVGPSGCGKSTLLRMLAGLENITSGEIAIGGRVVNSVPPKDRDIAMVFQNYALYPHMTVYDNMAFSLTLAKAPKAVMDEEVGRAAKILGLEQLLHRFPRQLSGGQRQRVAMGRAIVRNPQVFLFDEPLSNLDAKLRVQMRSEIKRFHQDLNATIIYVTHDQLEAVTMADKMAVMNGGLLQQYDSPANVFANPVNMFVASFVGSPAMSLVPLEVANQDGRTVLKSPEGWILPLSDANARKAATLTSRKVVLGARHSTIKLHKGQVEGAVPAKVYTVEPTGDITFVQAFLSSSIVNISLPPSVQVAPDEMVWLEFDQDRIHLFDGETEMALRTS